MKLFLLNTVDGLKPMYPEDFNEKKKLKLGKKYRAEIRVSRNPAFHRKFFAMINLAWQNSDEARREYANQEAFRYGLMIKAGYFDVIYKTESMAVTKPESIAFDQMDEKRFEKVFSDVLDVILAEYVPVERKEFLDQMIAFA